MKAWEIRSAKDVQALWLKVREVPGRTEGRNDRSEERYCLGVYLLALAQNGRLAYPFKVEQAIGSKSPDFMFTSESGEITGLEVTRATEQWFQREMTSAEREYRRREVAAAAAAKEPDPVVTPLSMLGWAGDEAEKQWCVLVRRAIEAKLAKFSGFRPASRHDLLIYDDTPLPAVDRRKVLLTLVPWASKLKGQMPTLGKISVIISLDVLFDVGGESHIFPYVQWSAPELDDTDQTQTFSERVELAGQVAVERAIREPSQWRIPRRETPAAGYYVDSKGRIVKRTSEGRRFEVRIKEDGSEVIVKELSSA
jgi:hypothetical protein